MGKSQLQICQSDSGRCLEAQNHHTRKMFPVNLHSDERPKAVGWTTPNQKKTG